jgi:hypothetical protein
MNTNSHGPTAGHEEIVRSLLHVAGLEPSDEEVQQLVAAYPDHRRAIDQLYTVTMPKEERPQPVFGFDGETFDDSG